MIFQVKSFRCFIFLLMLYGKVSSKYSSISVTKTGVQTPLQTDVAMVFYATVHNEGDHIQIVRLSMVECCLNNADSSNDCNSMKLRSGLGKALKPSQFYNLTMYWVNMNLFGRKGECHFYVNVHSKGSSKNDNEKSTEELKIAFDTPLGDSSNDVLQSIYSVIGGKSANAGYRKCDILDQDLLLKCKKRRCILDYSGHRSFYDKGKDTCSVTPDCSASENMMISPVSNLCRKQTPTSNVIASFTKEMKAGVNDTDITLRPSRAVAVEPINVVCVHGKMLENGHCQCDEHWLSQSFDPKKFDPEKTPYQMCNIRSPQGEISDRTSDTMYTFTILLIILLVVIPCFAIGLIFFCHSKRKKRKMLEEEKSDRLINHDEESDEEDVITEVASRREVKKSSTSHRSSQGPESGDSHQDFSNDKEPPQPPPDSNYPNSTHDNSKNPLAGNGNSKNPSRTRTNMKIHPDRPEHYDASHHSTTASHIINQPSRGGNVGKQKHKQHVWEMYPNRVTSDPGTSVKFKHFSGFDEIPLVDLELVNTVQNAFRSKSAPMMNYDISYTPQELYAVSPPPETIEVGNPMQTLFEKEIAQANSKESIVNCNIPQNEINLPMEETSATDVRASVKIKQELWAQFLKEFSEKNPIRQHSEFGIKDIEHDPQQSHACHAKSLPIMSTNKKDPAREVKNNENSGEYDINVNENRTYTVFKSNQASNMLSYDETPELTHEESNPRINIEDLENRIKAAMKSKDNLPDMEEPGETNFTLNTNMTAAQRIAMSALNYKDGEPDDLASDRVDSLLLLRALSKVNSSHSLGHSSSDTSDLVVGSPIGRNRFWVNQFIQDRAADDNFTDFPPLHQITSKLKQETTLRTHPLNNCDVPNSDLRQFADEQNVNNICQGHKTSHEVPIHKTNPFLCCTMYESEPTSTTLMENKE